MEIPGDAPTPHSAPSRQSNEGQSLPPGMATQLAEKFNHEKEAACQKIREQAAEDKMAACEEIKHQLQATFSQERQQLIRDHETTLAEAKEMAARRDRDRKQFVFTVRGHETLELSGSVPCNIFEAEPNSVLNRTYNGEWAYAKDDRGRACINSDPAHWPLILRWLSYGAVPDLAKCTCDFIAECRYWQLDRLLVEIETLRKAESCQPQPTTLSAVRILKTHEHELEVSCHEKDGRGGFGVEGRIHNFVQRFACSQNVEVSFQVYGASWTLRIKERGAFLALNAAPTEKQTASYSISFGRFPHMWKLPTYNGAAFTPGGQGYGALWPEDDKGAKVEQYPCMDLHGSLQVLVKVLFAEQK